MTDTTQRLAWYFGDGHADGDGTMRALLGGKGAGLAEMTRIGVPVPPGFTITTEVCVSYLHAGGTLPDRFDAELTEALGRVEAALDARFGDPDRPLLLSVRSGARVSMPGMMDTILNVGLNDQTVAGLAARTGDARFAWDSYRRFVQMFGDVVLGVHHFYFEEELTEARARAGVTDDAHLSEDNLRELVQRYKALISERCDTPFPESPREQLRAAILAVFDSWNNDRAEAYREMHNIPSSWGTAVTVQSMVFGNMGDTSATGVAFTRNPATGEHVFYGEFLVNAQGEDVVAGIRTPHGITRAEGGAESLEAVMPAAFSELMEIQRRLESHYRDMQDLEFTIQQGKVWILQTRSGKRTAAAEVKIAVDMANEGVIDRDEALLRVDPNRMKTLLHPRLDPDAELDALGKGLPGSCQRRGRLQRRGRRGGCRRGTPGGARADRDEPGGHPRHEGRRGHPHGTRRHDQSRRRRRSPDGQVLCRGLPRTARRLQVACGPHRRPRAQRGRRHHPQRHDR